ncbi:MAG: hypothetical protein LBR91_01915 [Puniceicoccales bacterium]|jgi:hypothetical protein|nr:hypothetical protein [Puniceicoccales bacterium]
MTNVDGIGSQGNAYAVGGSDGNQGPDNVTSPKPGDVNPTGDSVVVDRDVPQETNGPSQPEAIFSPSSPDYISGNKGLENIHGSLCSMLSLVGAGSEKDLSKMSIAELIIFAEMMNIDVQEERREVLATLKRVANNMNMDLSRLVYGFSLEAAEANKDKAYIDATSDLIKGAGALVGGVVSFGLSATSENNSKSSGVDDKSTSIDPSSTASNTAESGADVSEVSQEKTTNATKNETLKTEQAKVEQTRDEVRETEINETKDEVEKNEVATDGDEEEIEKEEGKINADDKKTDEVEGREKDVGEHEENITEDKEVVKDTKEKAEDDEKNIEDNKLVEDADNAATKERLEKNENDENNKEGVKKRTDTEISEKDLTEEDVISNREALEVKMDETADKLVASAEKMEVQNDRRERADKQQRIDKKNAAVGEIISNAVGLVGGGLKFASANEGHRADSRKSLEGFTEGIRNSVSNLSQGISESLKKADDSREKSIQNLSRLIGELVQSKKDIAHNI